MAPPKTPNQPRGTTLGSVQAGLVTFSIRAVPLPDTITAFLIVNAQVHKRLQRDRRPGKGDDDAGEGGDDASRSDEGQVTPEEFWPRLEALGKEAGKEWVGVGEMVWAFGPKRVGPNLLIDRTPGAPRSSVFRSFPFVFFRRREPY